MNWRGTSVVTGGGSGIGRALVHELARRDAEHIVVVDIDGRAAAETLRCGPAGAPGTVTTIAFDVSDAEALGAIVDTIEDKHGPIGAWFSNAGINRGQGLGDPADWRVMMDVNLMAHVHAARAVLPRMEARGRGAFVITASAAGLLTAVRTAIYATTKHAAVGLAEWLAIGAADGVTISCLCPEGVLTGMTRTGSRDATAASFLDPVDVAKITLDAVERGEFLVLTHPRTAEFEARRVTGRARWLRGMRRARRDAFGTDRIFTPERPA